MKFETKLFTVSAKSENKKSMLRLKTGAYSVDLKKDGAWIVLNKKNGRRVSISIPDVFSDIPDRDMCICVEDRNQKTRRSVYIDPNGNVSKSYADEEDLFEDDDPDSETGYAPVDLMDVDE